MIYIAGIDSSVTKLQHFTRSAFSSFEIVARSA